MSTPGSTAPGSRGGRGRPALSRDLIVDAAQRILEHDGVDALTMRRLAAEVGCSPMAELPALLGCPVKPPRM